MISEQAPYTPLPLHFYQNNPDKRLVYSWLSVGAQMSNSITPNDKFVQEDAKVIHLLEDYYNNLKSEDNKTNQISKNIFN